MSVRRWLLGGMFLVLLGCGPAERPKHKAEQPEPAPFELRAVHYFNGNVQRLADVKGKVVLLDFWAVWCPPCIMAFPHLSELYQRFHQDGLEILGVTSYFASDLRPDDEAKALQPFVAKHKLPYPILMISLTDWQRAASYYNLRGYPTLILLGRNGDVQGRWDGFSPEAMAVIAESVKDLLARK